MEHGSFKKFILPPDIEYQQLPLYSYSLLASFERLGPKVLVKKEEITITDTVLMGILVDCLLTCPKDLQNLFYIGTIRKPSEAMEKILDELYATTKKELFSEIPEQTILDICEVNNYYSHYKPDNRLKKIIADGEEYYNLLRQINGRYVITQEQKDTGDLIVNTLLTNPFTSYIFKTEEDEELFYQPCFKLKNIKCKPDILKINHTLKTIHIYDLKLTSFNEIDFDKAVLNFNYYLQATLYSQLIDQLIKQDNYFKEFSVESFEFLVINEKNLTPILWKFIDHLWEGNFMSKYRQIKPGWRTLINDIEWHKQNNNFTYTRDILNAKGRLLITSVSSDY